MILLAVVLLIAIPVLVVRIVTWLSWRKLPKAALVEGAVLVNAWSRRVKVTGPFTSCVDNRVLYWRARDDYGHVVSIPSDGVGWRTAP